MNTHLSCGRLAGRIGSIHTEHRKCLQCGGCINDDLTLKAKYCSVSCGNKYRRELRLGRGTVATPPDCKSGTHVVNTVGATPTGPTRLG